MASLLGFIKARSLTKKILGWQFYRSYLTAEAAADNVPQLLDVSAVIGTSWTTLEAAALIGKACDANVFWIPLSNRVAWRRNQPAFVSANRRKGRRAFNSLSRRLRPVVSGIEEVYLIDRHPDSPVEGAVLSLGLTPNQVTHVSTINDACKNLSSWRGRVVCLVDSMIMPGSGIYRLLRQLRKYIPGVEIVFIPGRPDSIGSSAAALEAVQTRSLIWPLEQYDDRYGWATAARLLFRYSNSTKHKAGPIGAQGLRAGVPLKRKPISTLAKWERQCIDFARKRNWLLFLKGYFVLKGLHPLENEINTFRSNLKKVSVGRRFDIVQSIDLISAPAGADLAQTSNARHIVDVNEFAYLEPRVGWQFKTMGRMHYNRIYRQIHQALHFTAGVISNSVGGARLTLHKYGRQALPVRNLRDPVSITSTITDIRSEFKIPEGAIVVVHVCTISPAYKSELAIEAMRFLPDNYHLVFVGYGNAGPYVKKVHLLVGKLGLGGRVHFRQEIADEQEYISYVSSADIGLVILDIESPFVRFNLPNRVCDLLAARLPMVSSYSYEVRHIFKDTGTGILVKSNDPKAYAHAILSQLEEKAARLDFNHAVERAAERYTWTAEMSSYFNYVELMKKRTKKPEVAFVFQRGLVRNRRVLRFAEQYLKRGYKVTIFCGALPPKELRETYSAIQFRHVPARHHLEAN